MHDRSEDGPETLARSELPILVQSLPNIDMRVSLQTPFQAPQKLQRQSSYERMNMYKIHVVDVQACIATMKGLNGSFVPRKSCKEKTKLQHRAYRIRGAP